MTREELRYEVIRAKGHGNGQLEITIDYIEQLHLFSKDEEVRSFESLLLVAGGHTPLRNRVYDFTELEKWCEINNFRCKEREDRRSIIIEAR